MLNNALRDSTFEYKNVLIFFKLFMKTRSTFFKSFYIILKFEHKKKIVLKKIIASPRVLNYIVRSVEFN